MSFDSHSRQALAFLREALTCRREGLAFRREVNAFWREALAFRREGKAFWREAFAFLRESFGVLARISERLYYGKQWLVII